MALDLDKTLQVIKNRQWVLGDIDWDAPGADLVPQEQRDRLKPFMADLMWIEFVGARGFAALARNAPNDTLREIYTYFHAEEQRHANAELALMKRWGMLDGDEIPAPNVNISHAMQLMEKYIDHTPFVGLATGIPMLETALDGALLKFLLDEIQDPVCHQVFAKVNNDESRHLAVGFDVLNQIGGNPISGLALAVIKLLVRLRLVSLPGLVAVIPLITNMRTNMEAMGMDSTRILTAVDRFVQAGDRDPDTAKSPMYRLARLYAKLVVRESKPLYKFSNGAQWVAERLPKRFEPELPSWKDQLTYEPVA